MPSRLSSPRPGTVPDPGSSPDLGLGGGGGGVRLPARPCAPGRPPSRATGVLHT